MNSSNKNKIFRTPHGGTNAVTELINSLPLDEQKKMLSKMKEIDPDRTELIEAMLVGIDDVEFFTQEMVRELTSKVSIELLATALKNRPQRIKDHLMNHLSKNNQRDFQEMQQSKMLLSKVIDAQIKIVGIIKELLSKGKVVINKKNGDELV